MGKVNALWQDELDSLFERFVTGAISREDFEVELSHYIPDPEEYSSALAIAIEERDEHTSANSQFGVGA